MANDPGVETRKIAIQCLYRIEETSSFANIIVPKMIEKSSLELRDRNLVTEIVYGATRMRRSLDWVIDRYLVSQPPAKLRSALRVGAYQIIHTRIPDHAAVNATVSAVAKKNKGVVNAVLRRIAEESDIKWPDDGTKLSYPNWIIDTLTKDLGSDEATRMMEKMNESPTVSIREDGYYQDLASQWVTDLVQIHENDLLLDLCSAPGGKASSLSRKARRVIACDVNLSRHKLIQENIQNLSISNISQVVSDGRDSPFKSKVFDHVLVDAPCSGLGVLHRRPDSRWRIREKDLDNLARLQVELLHSASHLVKEGGTLTYCVCTVTSQETIKVAKILESQLTNLRPQKMTHEKWRNFGNGLQILPHDFSTDGMTVFQWKC